MATVQSFLPYTNATVAQYVAWGQGISNALATLGWSKVADPAGVTWANVVSMTNVPLYNIPFAGTVLYAGAWTAGSAYTTGTINATGQTFNIVTDAGLTYVNIVATQQGTSTGTTGGVVAFQNSAATLTVTAVAAQSGGTAVYTVSSGVTASMIGQQFVVTIGGSNLLGNNAGTFVCVNTSGTTSITLGNPFATAQASVTGGAPGAQAISSTSVFSFMNGNTSGNWTNIGNNGSPGTNGFSTVNGLVGHQLTVAGYTGGATGNNGTYTVTSNAAVQNVSNNSVFCCVFTGTNATGTNVTVSEATHPASDPIHWMPYNYEIWKSNGPLSTSAPIYMKLIYVTCCGTTSFVGGNVASTQPGLGFDIGTTNPSTGQIGGNRTGETLMGFNSGTGVGNTYECDFCAPNGDELALILWRNATATSASIPVTIFIDRTKDQSGNTLSTFFTVGWASTNTARVEYTLFNNQTGGVINYNSGGGNAQGWTFPYCGLSGLAYQGLTPVLPIFPLPGYVANPVLMAVVMKSGDFTDGQLVNAVLYGGSHTFLMTKSTTVDQPQTVSGYPGIRWE